MTAPAPRCQPKPDALRHAFCNADEQDWAYLLAQLGDGGHGKFWKAVFAEVRAALQSEKTP